MLLSECTTCSRKELTFRISLLRTRHEVWMSAADCETASMSLPSVMQHTIQQYFHKTLQQSDRRMTIWSLTLEDSATVTPSSMGTFRTRFSPKKLRISTPFLSSPMMICNTKVTFLSAFEPGFSKQMKAHVNGEMGVDGTHLTKTVKIVLVNVFEVRSKQPEKPSAGFPRVRGSPCKRSPQSHQ